MAAVISGTEGQLFRVVPLCVVSGGSDHAGAAERELSLAGYYDVIRKTYVEQCGGVTYAECQRAVGIARRGRARRVIVYEDYLRGKQFEGALDDETVVYDRCLHAALADAAMLDYAVRRSEVYCPALLVTHGVEDGSHDPYNVGIGGDGSRGGGRGGRSAASQLRGQTYAFGTTQSQTFAHAQPPDLGMGYGCQRPVGRDEVPGRLPRVTPVIGRLQEQCQQLGIGQRRGPARKKLVVQILHPYSCALLYFIFALGTCLSVCIRRLLDVCRHVSGRMYVNLLCLLCGVGIVILCADLFRSAAIPVIRFGLGRVL